MTLRVMVELRLKPEQDVQAALAHARALGVTPDPDLEPVSMAATERAGSSLIVTGTVRDRAAVETMRRDPLVIEVWNDTPIAPFTP
jgi:hypothetical protein